MNLKRFVALLSFCALAFLCCCAKSVSAQVVGVPAAPPAPAVSGLVSLDAALADAALAIGAHARGLAHIAVAGIEAPSRDAEGFIADELSARLVKNRDFKILERGAALSAVDNEHKFQMSGIVDDKEIVGIGHYLGADAVVTGAFHCFAGFGQLRLRVIAVRDAQLLTLYTARVSLKDPVLAGVLPPKDRRPEVSDAALAHLNRGMDLLREGKYDGAVRELDQALAISWNLPIACFYRGWAYSLLGEQDRAIADYSAALTIKPDFSPALRDRGLAYHKNNKLSLALEDYNAAIKLSPNDYEAFIYRGIAREQIDGSYRSCVADFNAALKIKPDNADALFYRGRAYYNMNDMESAKSDLRAALRIDPGRRDAAVLLSQCEFHGGIWR